MVCAYCTATRSSCHRDRESAGDTEKIDSLKDSKAGRIYAAYVLLLHIAFAYLDPKYPLVDLPRNIKASEVPTWFVDCWDDAMKARSFKLVPAELKAL